MKFTFDAEKADFQRNKDGVFIMLPAASVDVQKFVGEAKGKYDCEIKKHREKRSLDSNAYAWLLINEIGNVLRASKDEVYLTMLKRYGQSFIVSVIEEAAEMAERTFPYCERSGEGEVKGKKFIHFKVFRGSSTYDSREMAVLIDGIISEAKALDIETATPAELERMKNEWGNMK